MTVLFPDLKTLAESGYVVRITDNGGRTCDRYTAIFGDGDYLGMSGAPEHPQGFSQWGEALDPSRPADDVQEGEEVDLALGDLSPHLANHIRWRCNEGYQDFLDALERRDPTAVALTRDAAETHYGLYNDGGKGIYLLDDRFWVRTDNGNWQLSVENNALAADFGPFDTAVEALRATLPDEYAWAGEEYHSTVEVGRLIPDSEVQTKIRSLEARVEATRVRP